MSQQLALHPLSFVEQGEDVVVGRIDTGSYAVLPPDGAHLLRKLSDGMTVDEAADWYEATYDEAVDMTEFVEALTELGFVSDGTSARSSLRRASNGSASRSSHPSPSSGTRRSS